jgi:hypothetical protein
LLPILTPKGISVKLRKNLDEFRSGTGGSIPIRNAGIEELF